MNPNQRLRIGLVGAGTHGRNAVIPSFVHSTRCTLAAVADRSAAHLAAIAHWNGPKYLSVDEMLDQAALDALYIATLPGTHCRFALAALERGLHVICEKPMAADLQEARRMTEAAQKAGRELIVMFENRIHPAYHRVREWIDLGHLGRVEAIHLQSFGKHPVAQPRRTDLLNAAGSLDCGIHQLDLARYWTRAGGWETIHALGTWLEEAVFNPPHIGILARLDSQVMVTFEDSFSYGYRLQSVPWNFSKQGLVIVGTEGVITDVRDREGVAFRLYSDEVNEQVAFSPLPHEEEIPRVLDHFAAVLAGDEEDRGWLARGEDGLQAQRIVDEVNRQCRDHAPRFPAAIHSR
ncbi:MAG TPA: Gfo/Idh/MocA family oxidoreductase [Chthoniobacteraceae bacterium]|nr:Gfo/Idh/MocA family oxidoreductase [Chthoniobacteraceae bacterium]